MVRELGAAVPHRATGCNAVQHVATQLLQRSTACCNAIQHAAAARMVDKARGGPSKRRGKARRGEARFAYNASIRRLARRGRASAEPISLGGFRRCVLKPTEGLLPRWPGNVEGRIWAEPARNAAKRARARIEQMSSPLVAASGLL
jgi:hypothetical protein